MSLLDTASLVITPNGTKASKLYSVVPSDGSGDMTVTRATTATRINSAGLIESVASNVPRLDYSNGSCPSILVEPQRTNLNLNSSDLSSASYTSGGGAGHSITITANYAISPDGTTNADRIQLTRGSSYAELFQRISGLSGQTVTISFYAKALTGTPTLATVTNNAYVNLVTFTNDWQRYEYTYVDAGATSGLNLITWTGLPTTSLTADILVWGVQLEVGGCATSYIPTTSASVTRNADVISKTAISSLIGQTEGTLYSEINVDKLLGVASRYIYHVSDGTTNNRIYLAFSGASSNILRARIFNGGTLQCSIDSSTITNTGVYKLALAYKNNDIVFYLNGVQIGTDTSAAIPTCSRVDLGHNYAGASQLTDGINIATLWKTRLTNTQLAQLTTI